MLAERLGFGAQFTEGLSEIKWVEKLYVQTQDRCHQIGIKLPDFEEFWMEERFTLAPGPGLPPMCAELRFDPATHPLCTPSGKIELFSSTIASFNYADCPGHPTWIEPDEWLGGKHAERFPLHLISNQPSTRLHSQLDFGRTSLSGKTGGREPCELNSFDAKARGIAEGDLVRLFNERGNCISVVHINNGIRRGVVKLSTGAWYDPEIPGDPTSRCLHGNPNVLTRDKGTSRLAQATSAHSCLVEMELLDGKHIPPAKAHRPPRIIKDRAAKSPGSDDHLECK